MAYIPPHKRHSDDRGRASPTPELLVPQFKRNLKLRSPKSVVDRSGKIAYANRAISRWLAVGLDDHDQFPYDTHLESISLDNFESFNRKQGEKPLILVNGHLPEDISKPRSPWTIIAEDVMQDLLSSFEVQRHEMKSPSLENEKPTLVARVGKILFHESPSVRLGTTEKNQVTESLLRQLKRSFYTNIPSSYMEYITDEVVPEIGVYFEEEKDIYHIKLSDKTRPDATLSCKCSVTEDKKLLLYKVELNQVRHMVIDISLPKNLDLRLMLCSKRILTNLTDDEMNIIRDLINSAILDSHVKGGLRWPLGKESSGDRYSVIGVWHTVYKAYKNSSIRLKVRHADRFDFKSGNGEATREIYLKLKGIVSELQEQRTDCDVISNMLKDSLKMIWTYFLCCEQFLT